MRKYEMVKNHLGLKFLLFTLYVLLAVQCPGSEAESCHLSSQLQGRKPSPGKCNKPTSDSYSPPVTDHTKATLTLNSFEKGGSGGGPSECDSQYHSNSELIVALSTGWYNHGERCYHYIRIDGNGNSVTAKVVDECDSTRGCKNDIVDASQAVWEALGVPENSNEWGWMDVTWSDA